LPRIEPKRRCSLVKHAKKASGIILAWTHQGRERIPPVFAPLAALREKIRLSAHIP